MCLEGREKSLLTTTIFSVIPRGSLDAYHSWRLTFSNRTPISRSWARMRDSNSTTFSPLRNILIFIWRMARSKFLFSLAQPVRSLSLTGCLLALSQHARARSQALVGFVVSSCGCDVQWCDNLGIYCYPPYRFPLIIGDGRLDGRESPTVAVSVLLLFRIYHWIQGCAPTIHEHSISIHRSYRC